LEGKKKCILFNSKEKETDMKALICGIVIAILGIVPAASHAQSWTGNVNVFLGVKNLDSDDWAPADDHGELGLLVDFKQETWPVSLAIDLLDSYGDDTVIDPFTGAAFKFEAETRELNVGVRKIWDQFPIIRPYVGGGLAFIKAEAKVSAFGASFSEDDSALGVWLNGGVYWTLFRAFNLGLELRYSKAEVTLAGVDAEAGGTHAGLLLGYHW
jgi:opacity protein-like surface antigen